MPLALNNNRGSVYSGRMKIEVQRGSVLLLFWLKVVWLTSQLPFRSYVHYLYTNLTKHECI